MTTDLIARLEAATGPVVRANVNTGHITLPPGGIGECTIMGGELTIGATGERLWFGNGKLKDFEAWAAARLAERESPHSALGKDKTI